MAETTSGLGDLQSLELELVRRNREIAQVRDAVRRREIENEDWKSRNGELLSRLAELDGELTKARNRAGVLEEQNQKHEAETKTRGAGGDVQAALARVLVLEQRSAQLEGRLDAEKDARSADAERAKMQAEALEQQLDQERELCRGLQRQMDTSRGEAEEITVRMHSAEQSLHAQASQHKESTSARITELEQELAIGGHSRRELEEELSEVTSDRDGLNKRMSTNSRELNEAQARLRDLQGDVAASKEQYASERDELTRQLAAAKGDLDGARKSGQAISLEAFAVEQRLRDEVHEISMKAEALELELAATVSNSASSVKLDSQLKNLQSENASMMKRELMHREDFANVKVSHQEQTESFAMLQEDMRGRHLEATNEIIRLRMQLEESRRARSLEMRALVTKMCTPGSGGGSDPLSHTVPLQRLL